MHYKAVDKIIRMEKEKDRLQEIFDKVSKHLLTQNERAWNSGNSECKYRIGELKCAAGCLIPDEDYSSEMECKRVNDLSYFKNNYSELEVSLIRLLQIIHDSYCVDLWFFELKSIANIWGLEWKL